MTNKTTYDALVLYSAGLDSLLAARVLEAQGLRVKCLHFVSPFFGHPGRVKGWRATYGLDIDIVNIGDAYIDMMRKGPRYGFGKLFNPCVDCKIIMIEHARALMPRYGATFIATGEVVGQRPMSQRRDAMNSIRNETTSEDILLRPLCALILDPTPMELSGLVDRERLYGFSGRGRNEQLRLAAEFGITDIPTPGGGCKLTESASACRYAPVFQHHPTATAQDFHLANVGRQYWSGAHWLSIGRDQRSNEMIERNITPGDLVFSLRDFPGPLALGRQVAGDWSDDAVADAAAFVASFSPKARKAETDIAVAVRHGETTRDVVVRPSRETALGWKETSWDDAVPVRNAMDPHNH
ncbi:hypothetical protein GGQ74_002794 [Desulfobaculum xiamenense]|uniref:NFACT protein RNA binding domain-containing protein n=1 Tax=Desulfobaculum xiamenense TaxID=995050 RepID=A0A846QQ41_9BACT|nr:tRNA(5-methylaminomethyl-2-thiouridylate) methyltransferase [Desulfobaculum xiamenense]NJB69100.1 hypothetical protein [Desulfobaculum xiamenense]